MSAMGAGDIIITSQRTERTSRYTLLPNGEVRCPDILESLYRHKLAGLQLENHRLESTNVKHHLKDSDRRLSIEATIIKLILERAVERALGDFTETQDFGIQLRGDINLLHARALSFLCIVYSVLSLDCSCPAFAAARVAGAAIFDGLYMGAAGCTEGIGKGVGAGDELAFAPVSPLVAGDGCAGFSFGAHPVRSRGSAKPSAAILDQDIALPPRFAFHC